MGHVTVVSAGGVASSEVPSKVTYPQRLWMVDSGLWGGIRGDGLVGVAVLRKPLSREMPNHVGGPEGEPVKMISRC